jgi:hypothetical protein
MKDTGQEALERGKSVAQDAAQAATQTVQRRGKQEADALQKSVAEKTDEATRAN